MHPAVTYTVGRIGLFLLAAGGLWLAGMDPLLALIGGMLISMVMSWFLLRGPREALAQRLEAGAERRRRLKAEVDAAMAEVDPAAQEHASSAEGADVPRNDAS